jgi:hypothetical protein
MDLRPFPKAEPAMKKTHCKHGHEMTPENTYTRPMGYDECLLCRRASQLAWRAARPARGGPPGRLPNYNFPKIKFCSKDHAIIGDNIAFSSRRMECRTCLRMYDSLKRKNGNLAESTIRNVLRGLREGMTINNLAGWRGDKGAGGKIVDTARLNRFCDENPKLGKRWRG